MWCGDCYTSSEYLDFQTQVDPRLLDTELDGTVMEDGWPRNPWKTSKPDPFAFHYARNGDHLMTHFECDTCVFRKLRDGDYPDHSRPTDKLLLACIRRVNLDAFWSSAKNTVTSNRGVVEKGIRLSTRMGTKGPYLDPGPFPLHDHCGYEVACQMVLDSTGVGTYSKTYKQFNTIRRLRTSFVNQARTSVKIVGRVLAMVDVKGHFQRFSTEAVGSDWFAMFSEGCKRRMGQVWRPNQAISVELLHALLAKIEEKVLNTDEPAEGALWITLGAYVVICFVVSLRGPEGLLLDLEGLDEMVNPLTQNHLIIPLLGQVKGEHHARAHLLPCVFVTSSGIQVQLWLQRLVQLRTREGRTKGPAICDSEGIQLSTRILNARFVECLCDILEESPELFLANIKNAGDIETWYNVFRSLRRGSNSRALSQGISDTCTSIINRWHLKEKAKGRMPSFTNMPQYYADINLLTENFLIYTFGM